MTNNQQKRYFTDIKTGRIFLLRKLFFGFVKTKAYMVICLTKQGQFAVIYTDKTRREQLAFFNIKNCIIKQETNNQSRVVIEFKNSISSRCLHFEARDLEDAKSWVQAFTGKQENVMDKKKTPCARTLSFANAADSLQNTTEYQIYSATSIML